MAELRLPRIGTIRKGAPKPEEGPGKDLDYFRLDRADPAVAEVWAAVMGPQPKTISGILPYSDPAENLSIWDELWQGKRLMWRGDGERLHVKLDGNSYVRYAPGSGPAQPAAAGQMVNKLKVARVSRLRLLLPQLRVAGIFEVMSSSAIDADELWGNLMWIRSTVATLQGAPVTVYRAERQFNVPQDNGKTMIVKKHMLHMMLDGRYLDALLPAPGGKPAPLLAAPVVPAALTATTGQGVDDDAPEDGEYEDAPQSPLDTYLFLAEQRPGVQAVAFVNGRLRAWVNYVTGDAFDPTHADYLNEVLDRYCSAVADNDNTHTKAAAEKARDDYRQGLAALSGDGQQDDLFGDAEYTERKAVAQAALATAQGQLD
jgi:hypothetical protein